MILASQKKFKFVVKIVAAVTCATFIWQDFAMANGGSPAWKQVNTAPAASALQTPVSQYEISPELALRQAAHQGKGDEVVINIQDAHASIGAQKAIAEMIKGLVGQYDMDLVGVEGTEGAIDPALVSSFPVKAVREKAAEALLRSTRIGAAEFFKIISQDKVELYGVEDEGLYKKNVHAYQRLLGEQAKISAQLFKLFEAVKKLEKKLFTPEMVEFSRNRFLHENGDLKFSDYWKFLKPLADKAQVAYSDLPNLDMLVRATELEDAIDFKAATIQRDSLVSELRKRLKGAELKALVQQAVQFKIGRITAGRFHAELAVAAQKAGVDPASFAELIKFSEYAVLYEAIDLLAVFGETARFEDRLRAKLMSSGDARRLDQVSNVIRVMGKLLESKLTTADRAFFESNRKQFEIAAIKELF